MTRLIAIFQLEFFLETTYRQLDQRANFGNNWRHERVSIKASSIKGLESINKIIRANWYELKLINSASMLPDPLLKYPNLKFNGRYLWMKFDTIYFEDKEDYVKAALTL